VIEFKPKIERKPKEEIVPLKKWEESEVEKQERIQFLWETKLKSRGCFLTILEFIGLSKN
jgi:hypothetical protein